MTTDQMKGNLMSKNYRKALENLDLFLADTEGETTEEIAKQLKDQGLNVEEFLSKVKSKALDFTVT